jgi:hypothetical protein
VTARQCRLVDPGWPSIIFNSSSQSTAESWACSGPCNSFTALMNAENSRSARRIPNTIVQLFSARTSVVMQAEIQSDLLYDYRYTTTELTWTHIRSGRRKCGRSGYDCWPPGISTICRSISANRSAIGKTRQTLKITFLMPVILLSIRRQMKCLREWETLWPFRARS